MLKVLYVPDINDPSQKHTVKTVLPDGLHKLAQGGCLKKKTAKKKKSEAGRMGRGSYNVESLL